MSFRAVIWALGLQANLSGSERLVLIYLADFCNEEKGYAWPSIKKLSGRTGLSRSTVKRSISSLVEKELVETAAQSRAINGHRFTNRYYLTCFPYRPQRRNYSVTGDFDPAGDWDEHAEIPYR